MDVRRLRDLPDIPLSEEIVANREFRFRLDRLPVRFRLPSFYEYRRIQHRLFILPYLLLIDYKSVSDVQERVGKMLEGVDSGLPIAERMKRQRFRCDVVRELATLIATCITPLNPFRRIGWTRWLMRLGMDAFQDLAALILYVNDCVKKKRLAIVQSGINNHTLTRWTSGVSTPSSPKNSEHRGIGASLGLT
jgi:hypothetical protein